MTILGCDKDGAFLDQLSKDATSLDPNSESFSASFYKLPANNNVRFSTIQELGLSQPNNLMPVPNWGPVSGSPLTGKSNLFTDQNVSDSFFDKVNFVGAFRSDSSTDNWMLKWTNFNPQITSY